MAKSKSGKRGFVGTEPLGPPADVAATDYYRKGGQRPLTRGERARSAGGKRAPAQKALTRGGRR